MRWPPPQRLSFFLLCPCRMGFEPDGLSFCPPTWTRFFFLIEIPASVEYELASLCRGKWIADAVFFPDSLPFDGGAICHGDSINQPVPKAPASFFFFFFPPPFPPPLVRGLPHGYWHTTWVNDRSVPPSLLPPSFSPPQGLCRLSVVLPGVLKPASRACFAPPPPFPMRYSSGVSLTRPVHWACLFPSPCGQKPAPRVLLPNLSSDRRAQFSARVFSHSVGSASGFFFFFGIFFFLHKS